MTSKLPYLTIALLTLTVPSHGAAGDTGAPIAADKDIPELAQMYKEDQSDRMPPSGQSIDWSVVGLRDRAREAKVKDYYGKELLQAGEDYQRAAMILQHASQPEDFLLAHELCIVAISKGVDARWLAAASEDRFLRSIGRPQRFGTQSSKMNRSPWSLGEVDLFVADEHRKLMHVPSLAEARARLDKQNGLNEKEKAPNQAALPMTPAVTPPAGPGASQP
jgi:hypothetical protein